MARRSDHTRDELKQLILERARLIVARDGFEALTARRIAQDIGYTPGTIYNLFQSMDDLYLQINAQTLEDLYRVLSAPMCNDPNKTPVQNMTAMARAYIDFTQKERAFWMMLFTHRMPNDEAPGDWYQEKINRLFDPLESVLAPYFKPQQKRQQRMAARVLWSSVHGLCYLQETGKIPLINDRASIEDMTTYLIKTFVNGMRGQAN